MALKFLLFNFLIILPLTGEAKLNYPLETICQDLNVALMKIDVINFNIANANTTRTKTGGAYKRQIVKNCKKGICKKIKDNTPAPLKYEPNHPDANKNGYVTMSNVNVMKEMSELIKAQRVYEAILTAANLDKKEILVGTKYNACFKKYKYFKAHYNYRDYLGRKKSI